MRDFVIYIIVVSVLLCCSIPENLSQQFSPTQTPTQITVPSQTATPQVTATPRIITPTSSPTLSPTPTMEAVNGIYVVKEGDTLGAIALHFGIPLGYLADQNGITNPNLIYPGQTIVIPAWPPEEVTNSRQIVVDTESQKLYAYEDGKLVREFVVSTGVAEHPTVKGQFEIYIKYESTTMSGPGYTFPDVRYTMYFFQGYGIHGTYWHNNFGQPMSHGCVNMTEDDAEWLFNWASVGTPVWVF